MNLHLCNQNLACSLGRYRILKLVPWWLQAAYACDVTYVTGQELGFAYLRDNTANSPQDLVRQAPAVASGVRHRHPHQRTQTPAQQTQPAHHPRLQWADEGTHSTLALQPATLPRIAHV